MRELKVDEVAAKLKAERSVIIVPGYGMAVARAQGAVNELAKKLAKRGVEVRFAIHPVAGRLPGHMNVLLAEAGVPYDTVLEMEQINQDFPRTDVVLVIGANDIVNPGALDDKSSPIYGMPVLEVWKSRLVVVLKRGKGAGYAGIENPLFFHEEPACSTATRRRAWTPSPPRSEAGITAAGAERCAGARRTAWTSSPWGCDAPRLGGRMLLPCASCGRHVRETSLACPFCGRRARLVRGAVIGAGRAMAGTLVLGAMLGGCGNDTAAPPPPPTTPTTQTQPASAPPAAPAPTAAEAAPSEPSPAAEAEPIAAPAQEPLAAEPEAPEVTTAPDEPLAPNEPPPSRRIVRRPTPTTMDPGPRDPRLIAAYGGAPMPDRPEL
jgi:hypothetical protein